MTFIEVIWGQMSSFEDNTGFRPCLKKAADMGVVSLCLSCQDASTDMQHDQLGHLAFT